MERVILRSVHQPNSLPNQNQTRHSPVFLVSVRLHARVMSLVVQVSHAVDGTALSSLLVSHTLQFGDSGTSTSTRLARSRNASFDRQPPSDSSRSTSPVKRRTVKWCRSKFSVSFLWIFSSRLLSACCSPSRSRFLLLLHAYHSENLVKVTRPTTWSRSTRTFLFPIHAQWPSMKRSSATARTVSDHLIISWTHSALISTVLDASTDPPFPRRARLSQRYCNKHPIFLSTRPPPTRSALASGKPRW
jgi:hypothetical protein